MPSPTALDPAACTCLPAACSRWEDLISTTEPAPRPVDGRQVRGEARRAALIQATRELLVERGYRDTTLTQIIARAGGSRETIYRTLGGKSGIFKAIVADVGEELAASIVDQAWLELSPRAALTQLGLRLASIWLSDEGKAVNRVVVSEGLQTPEVVEAWYQGGSLLTIEALARYLQRHADTGDLKPHDPTLVARQYVTLLIGEIALPVIAGPEHRQPMEVHVQRCVDFVLAAIEAP